jgi:hypothetical protein
VYRKIADALLKEADRRRKTADTVEDGGQDVHRTGGVSMSNLVMALQKQECH